ncbi:MAG: protein kinase [Pirellulaceae bacterium]|jgi:serine/threonine-protein kinase|nr:protein kinase [Pirellulaceae bacterium]MDP7019858.1 protein kinase [Pirellulaceae bacterium]
MAGPETCSHGYRLLANHELNGLRVGDGCPHCQVTLTAFDEQVTAETCEDDFDELPPPPQQSRGRPAGSDAIPARSLLERAASHGLLSADDLEQFASEVSDDGAEESTEELADRLIRLGILSSFQATELCKQNPDPLQLGEYLLVDRIGRGGMGDVFRAKHQKLDRVVALKVLPPEFSHRRTAVERFEREASSTAKLQHDNIVTVFDFGEDRNRRFFTMQLVVGSSLAELLAAGPLDSKRAATLLEPVARAIAAAHEQSILHRDLKPHNILIDGETDRPLVADFGLARLMDGEGELTHSGMVLGTPPYMSPEQAKSAADTTERSDVYSLGATLYHTLTGRPPFQAASTMETLRQVLQEAPAPPRQLNADVDRDLETICLKCLEKETTGRYPTAAALARELQRYLAGEPIHARPIPRSARAWRWCRRNPLVASLLTLSLAGFMAAFASTAVGYLRVRAEHARAERGFAEARHVVFDFLTRVSDETLLNQPGMQTLKRDLLTKALSYYQSFLSERGDDPAIREEAARIHYSIGLISEQILTEADALAALQTARRMQNELRARDPTNMALKTDVAKTANAEARVLFRMGGVDDALAAYDTARKLRSEVSQADPDDVETARLLANTHMNIGIIHKFVAQTRGEPARLDDAYAQMLQAQAIRRRLIQRGEPTVALKRDTAMGSYNLGNLTALLDDARGDQSYDHFEAARMTFADLLVAEPDHIEYEFKLALATSRLADLEDDLTAAKDRYEDARRRLDRLSMRNPRVRSYKQELVRSLQALADVQSQLADGPAAKSSLLEAIKHLAELHRQDSSALTTIRQMGMAHLSLGEAEPGDRRAHYTAARDWLKKYAERDPDDVVVAESIEELDSKLADLDDKAK